MNENEVFTVPGVVAEHGRMYIYIQQLNDKSLSMQFDDIGAYIKTAFELNNAPTDGALMNESFIISTPDDRRFYALSFRGDIGRWHELILSYARDTGLVTATINDHSLSISDELTFSLLDCIGESSY